MLNQGDIVEGTFEVVTWWLNNRQGKFDSSQKETINVNPFLLPLVGALHGLESVEELGEVLIAAHLIAGHNTGFGKLFDEKLLPQVFGTSKLSKSFRETNAPYSQSAFNDIDHVVHRTGYDDLLSLKASPWTINLGASKDLNESFRQIRLHHINPYPGKYGEIAVGVIYGTDDALTDKYQILRGQTERQRNLHNVQDLTDTVNVYAGRKFWTWLNAGEESTQDWVLEGTLLAAQQFRDFEGQRNLIQQLASTSKAFAALASEGDEPDWEGMLRAVNG